ncbi:hypothetical protein GCM10028805_33060 [Spirosoma harenae]
MNPAKSWLDKVAKGQSVIAKTRPASSHEEQLIRNRNHLCFTLRGRDSTGRDAVYVVLIDEARKSAFLKHQVGDTYNLEEYGKIIYSAYGTTIPPDVCQMLAETYGFENLG